MNNYRTIQQKDMHKLFPAWETNIPTLGTKYSQPGNKTGLRLALSLLLMLVLGINTAWGQTDYSGVYYIGSVGYNAANTTTNYYLCPTEEWCYYKATDDFWPSNTSEENKTMPFLTTHTCRDNEYDVNEKAVWIVEKHPKENYYYIKRAHDGKYIVLNGQINTTSDANRMRVHIETLANPDNKALFALIPNSTAFNIKPKTLETYLTVNGGNDNSLKGVTGKGGGPTGYTTTKGIIGIFPTLDGNANFYLEKALSIDAPTITNNNDGTFTITAASEAVIYYTTGSTTVCSTPTTLSYTGTGTTSVIINQTEGMEVIKAIAKAESDPYPTNVTTYNLPKCERPTISVSGGTVTINCATGGATIHYTTDGSPATSTSTVYTEPFAKDDASIFRAIATKDGYITSSEAILMPATEVSSSSEITNMAGNYILAEDFTSSAAIGSSSNPFRGTIDGNYHAFSLTGHALIDVADGATIKNIMISSASISGSDDAGAIVNTATGDTKIYNCGVLSGTVSGSGNVGGLVGHIKSGSKVRVVNCYNFATVSGGSTMAGIVGNNEGTVGDVRIAMCMMYGDMNGTSPVYAGNHTSNASDFTEYNYWRSKANLTYTTYNDQLAIDKDDYLTRFPFYRHILNTHRELAAYFLFANNTTEGSVSDIAEAQVEEIGHWSIDKSKAIYPIIEKWEKNTKKVLNAPSGTAVSVRKGDGTPITSLKVKVIIGANTYTTFPGTETELTLPITDMDEENHDYTWGKVVLPFANEFEVNTNYDKICTGWKITAVEGGNGAEYSNYNMSDRECTAKDLYSNTGFIFAQGGYYIVPYNVTKIEITANFANAFYLSDESYDISYSGDNTADKGAGYVGRSVLGGSTPTTYHDKPVYNTLSAALGAMSSSGTTHEQAVVLVGNYHQEEGALTTANGYTIMSIDADNNQEPDYAIYSNYTTDRPAIPPTRFDFVAMIPVGMSAHVTNTKFYPNIPIFKPRGWFELTETSLLRADQFELDSNYFNTSASDTKNYRCIINGGYFTQMVRSNQTSCTKVSYFQIGGKAYVKEFYPGNHSKKSAANKLVPVNVTGGEIEQCFMTGYGLGTAYGPNIFFWCAGGKIGKFLGAYMEKPRQSTSADGNVNLTAKIDHAIIGRFFGGGTSPSACVTGNINVTIDNSRVDFYCGGPEFGNMTEGKTVKTEATNTYFKEYYGAGFGGTGITYTNDKDTGEDLKNKNTFSYNTGYFNECYVATNKTDIGRLRYKANYGIGNCYKFEFVMHSRGNQAVSRFFTGYARFSLASTGNVTNILNGCEIENDFYGAGCQGKVNGTVTSTLTGCTVHGSAFGGGYKAESNQVDVYPVTSPTLSTYNSETCLFTDFGTIAPETYEWVQGTSAKNNTVEGNKLYTGTDVTLTDLGNVTGAISLTINGGSVTENVYGGGNESKSLNNTTVAIENGAQITGNVYGGGNLANVEGNTQVNITGGTIAENVFGGGKGEADEFSCSKAMVGVNNAGAGADLTTEENKNKGTKVTISNGTVNGNVYGGGEVGRVEWNTQVTIGAVSGGGTPIVNGSVFGAGAGVATHGYAALVRGNSTVTIQGKAKVLQNVYGGGEQATVGRYWVKGINNVDSEGNPIPSAPSAPTDMPDEMPYKTMSGGQCNVIVQGSAQVGPDGEATPTAGHVFGAGKGVTPAYVHEGDKTNWSKRMVDYNLEKHTGEPGTTWDYYEAYTEAQKADENFKKYVWEYFTTEDKYFEFLQTLALVTGTDVTIGGATVKGNVYGGSESGFVQDNTDVKVTSGTIGTSGTTTNGNVFGGGKGLLEFAEAGKVKGTATVAINNGTVKGNVYGGGELGDVGLITKPVDYNYTWKQSDGNTNNTAGNNDITDTNNNTGICTVTISGGTIGTSGSMSSEHGNVFGAGKGAGTTFWCEKAIAFATNVSVNGGTVHGNVYGGGQIGRVEDDAKVTIGGAAAETGADIKGSVFGAGAGLATHGYSALVRGNTKVTIDGYAKVAKSVYGGGETASVGRYGLNAQKMPNILVGGGICELKVQGNATIGEDVFGACKGVTPAYNNTQGDDNRSKRMVTYDPEREVNPHLEGNEDTFWNFYDDDHRFVWEYFTTSEDYSQYLETLALATHPEVTIDGSATVGRSVYGGGELGLTKGSVIVNIKGGTIEKDVYGGGALADTNTTELVADNYPTTTPETNEDGSIKTKEVRPTTTVNLLGGTIKGDAYGGGLGAADSPAYVHGDVLVDLNGTTEMSNGKATTNGTALESTVKGCIVNQVFGCNNVNGSPKRDVMVHIYATQNAAATQIANTSGETPVTNAKVKDRYDVTAVYGGGNQAAYNPETPYNGITGSKTQVIIDGCDKTSIETVYGGGNAAAVPETNVTINAAYEIGYVFGGGNGKDEIAPGVENPGADVGTLDHGTTIYGTGHANSTLIGGLIHEAYGGSNTKGVIKGSINQITDPKDPNVEPDCCELKLEKIVGAGKYADIDGDVNMTLSCQPNQKVDLLFAGADEANVNGNITLNITNGHFGSVFGGNNLGGAIKGKITVNVEETGCQPIKIDNLYLGSNKAAYSVYGYYESDEVHEVTGKKILKPRTSEDDEHTKVENPATDETHTFPYADPVLNIISCTYLGNVFGGGLGEEAVMYANPTVNVNMVAGDHAATAVPAMMTELDLDVTKTAPNPDKLGIIRNVFGGGDAANIAGNTTVNIATEEGKSAYIIGSVFGGGNAADVLGNTNVTMSGGYVFNGIFGGGYAGNVGTFTRSTDSQYTSVFGHTAHEGCIGKPISCAEGTGKCTVLVNGGQIGPISVATEGMNRSVDDGGPVPEGWVWGAGQGLVEDPATYPDTHFKSYVGSTDVTIGGTAFVLESIIGGGEFGRVLGDTKVTIQENCQIGVGAGKVDGDGKPIRYTDEQFIDPTTTEVTESNALVECSHFPYGKVIGGKKQYLPYDPYYDEFCENDNTFADNHPDLSPASAADASDGKTWIGCVFAGGSGYMPYKKDDESGYDWCSSAGLVEGNTNLTISGGHILTNVYGGNEVTNVKGTCKVTMTGGTIGVPRTVQQIIDHPLTCYLFGAGKGDPRPHFNTETNVQNVEIDITGGIIYGSVFGGGEDGHVQRDVKITIGDDSHNGPKIGTWGTTYVDGNIFGGGRGFSGDAYTAGNVAGCVDLDIKGGTILGSIYGGGRLGSVGYGLYPPTAGETYYGAMRPDNTGDDANNTTIDNFKRGYIDIEISGGTIGNGYEYIIPSAANTPNGLTFADIASWTDANWKTWKTHNNIPLTEFDTETYRLKHTKGGNVFAGGMGRLYQLDGTSYISEVDWWKLGCVKSTKLTITGGTIKSNVYGGGELGQVVGYHTTTNAASESINASTEIIIQDDNTTIIGTEVKDGSNNTQYTFGSVFGGGYGSLIEKIEVQRGTSTISSYPKYIAGFVKEDTKIDMQDGKVKACIYGGGEMASVGESTTSGETTTVTGSTYVAISGGTVGIAPIEVSGTKRYFGGAKMGNVYGGGSGHGNTVRSGRVMKNTNVTISGSDTRIYHNIYGGGAYGTVGEFKYTEDTNNYNKVIGVEKLKTSGTGVATVTITGGTIGYDGKENGMVFGSSRGDVNAPNERDDHTAWVYDANVTIGTQGSETGPAIKGSVYGSGENGHTFHNTDVKVHSGTIGITDTSIDGGAAYAYRGNVYGGGCGTDKYYEDPTQETHDGNGQLYNPLAGIVYGNATVTMDGGHVVHNVYGAGAMGSVGKASDAASGKTTINISGGRIGYDGEGNGHVFGAARGEHGVSTAASNLANVRETEVNINYAATPAGDTEGKTAKLIAGSVFGGGEAGTVKGSVAVNMTGGLILKDIYGGGALADTQTAYSDNTSYTTTVNLLGGTIGGDAYGGGLGQKKEFNGAISDIEATVYGDITVNLGTLGTAATNESPAVPATATAFNVNYENTGEKDEANNPIMVVQSGRVFGCNNLNGSPQGNVTVNVYKTVEGNVARTAAEDPNAQEKRASRDANVSHTYELAAVYGGGNLANYTATGKKANVIIHTCDVSVQYVYGGGNAAAVPGTDVLVKGAWEIDHVFGGGNGKDMYKKGNEWILNAGADVAGNTNTLLIGGYIHEAYGGSNEKGTIGGNVTINTNSEHEDCACALELTKLYGAGKNADIEGDLIVVLDCAPETKTEEIYGGAENANVKGNVELTITSGTFGKVFGGNNQSGSIFGHIVLNVEETSCRPIIIDELYGCGNNAAYSVYGYKDGGTDADGYPIYIPRTSKNDGTAVTFPGKPHTNPGEQGYDDPQVNIISCTRIDKVFGGGLGSGATVYGNPTVNIDQIYGKAYVDNDPTKSYTETATTLGVIGDVFGGGNEANVVGNTNVNIGTRNEVWLHQSVNENGTYIMYPANTESGNGLSVVGANITGNVYGGGNEAEVTGDTNVNIGKKSE